MTACRLFEWFFRNRETGAITVAQAPNLLLWIVIVAGLLLRIWRPTGMAGSVLAVAVKGGLFLWAADEFVRGVNPWWRCLGATIAVYELGAALC